MVRRGRRCKRRSHHIASVVAVDRIAALLDVGVSEALVQATYGLVVAVAGVALAADLRLGAWSRSAATGIVSSWVQARMPRPSGIDWRASSGTLRSWSATQPARAAFADEAGQPIERPAAGSGRTVLPVFDGGNQVAVVVHDDAVLGDPGLVDAVAAATGSRS